MEENLRKVHQSLPVSVPIHIYNKYLQKKKEQKLTTAMPEFGSDLKEPVKMINKEKGSNRRKKETQTSESTDELTPPVEVIDLEPENTFENNNNYDCKCGHKAKKTNNDQVYAPLMDLNIILDIIFNLILTKSIIYKDGSTQTDIDENQWDPEVLKEISYFSSRFQHFFYTLYNTCTLLFKSKGKSQTRVFTQKKQKKFLEAIKSLVYTITAGDEGSDNGDESEEVQNNQDIKQQVTDQDHNDKSDTLPGIGTSAVEYISINEKTPQTDTILPNENISAPENDIQEQILPWGEQGVTNQMQQRKSTAINFSGPASYESNNQHYLNMNNTPQMIYENTLRLSRLPRYQVMQQQFFQNPAAFPPVRFPNSNNIRSPYQRRTLYNQQRRQKRSSEKRPMEPPLFSQMPQMYNPENFQHSTFYPQNSYPHPNNS